MRGIAKYLYGAGFLVCTAFVVMSSCTGGRAQTRIDLSQAKFVGAKKCLMCHEDHAAGLVGSAHWIKADTKTPAAQKGCESCHGPGGLHVQNQADDKKGIADIISFKEGSPFPGFQQSEQCLQCHEQKHRDWNRSPHEELGCAACHVAHDAAQPHLLKIADQKELCSSCHRNVTAQFQLISHHPLAEGGMTCSSCHDPHGASPRDRSASATNDSCLKCHREQQGPFTFEHAALREGCTTCHQPHGSTAKRLLTEPDYNLCLRCHYQAAYYQALGHYSHRRATNQPEIGAQYANCVACHRAVHGSNFSKEFRTP